MKHETNQFVDLLIQEGWLKTPEIIEAFRKIKREDFVSDEIKDLAELNEALSIGYGQTISQPLTVAFMLELLQPKEGDKILDVGAGSGWTAALLAFIVRHSAVVSTIVETTAEKKNGKVIAVEVIPELAEFGEKNAAKYSFIEKGIVQFVCADGSKGFRKEAPYDKILASASGSNLPEEWKKQLKVGGRIVCPIGNSIWLFFKKTETAFEQTEYPGFVFVPLIEK